MFYIAFHSIGFCLIVSEPVAFPFWKQIISEIILIEPIFKSKHLQDFYQNIDSTKMKIF